jgi:hypothetical protein
MMATLVFDKPHFLGRFQRERVDVIAGVMVLSEVKRLMMMSGPGASTCASECGETATSRINEVTTTTVPADIAGPVNRVRNFKCDSSSFGHSPLERSAVGPNAMKDHSDLACEGNLRLFHSNPFDELHSPGLEGRPLVGAMK